MCDIATLKYGNYSSHIRVVPREEVLPVNADLVVFDNNTASLFVERNAERSLVLPSGESAKNWISVERIINRALTISLGRDSLIVGVGGGVVSDVTAFAASIYMRGCKLILVPTTLLGMVDAATGGKTGIDFGGVKNLLGSFYPAEEVRICPSLLQTLPDHEYLSGLVEVIKHAMIDANPSRKLWNCMVNKREQILKRQNDVLQNLIIDALQVKVEIVSNDLEEHGSRAFLNFGHTFGHALESATNFKRWSHGEAVAWGMLRALELGERLSITDKQWARDCRNLINSYGFDIVTPQVSPEEIKLAMQSDKKKKDGKLRFILLHGLGEPTIQEVPEKDLDAVLGI